MSKVTIRMLSTATIVKGQGVGSAYLEQVGLVKTNTEDFTILTKHQRGDADIYHIHTINPTFYLRMRKKRANVVYVHFVPSTLDGSIRLPRWLFRLYKWYITKFYKKADELVVVNPCFKKDLISIGIKEDSITYIPNYVSMDNFFPLKNDEKARIRKDFGLSEEKFIVLGIGQIQNRKGVESFVEVAKLNPDIEFVWAGGFSFGMLSDGYDKLKKLYNNPPKNVHFIGIVDREKMNEVINIGDALFLPSYNELFPMSILEASNVGKPIILRDLNLYRDILYDWYEKGNTVQEFSKIIQKLKSNEAFYKKAVENSTRIKEYYSKENVSNLWKEYYLRIYDKYSNRRKKK